MIEPDVPDRGLTHFALGAWQDLCMQRSPGDGEGASTYMRRFVTCRACLDKMGDER